VTSVLAHVELQLTPTEDAALLPTGEQEMHETREDPAFAHADAGPQQSAAAAVPATPVRSRQVSANINPKDPSTWGRVARNNPCPCGSGKKYKHCHGQLA
jgi:preprotein translocase subunit SecA